MASTTQSEKPIDEGIKNLKIDPSKLGDANLAPSKDRSISDTTSCISSTGDASSSAKDIDLESLPADQGMYYPATNYYGYYYPGYDSPVGKLNNQGYFLSSEGLEIQYPVIQGDNGSLAYYMPSFQPDCGPYSPYLPGATIGIDGQYLGQQPYVLSPMSPQPIATSGYFPTLLPYGSELMPSYLWDPSLLVGDGTHGNGYGAIPTVPVSKPSFSDPSRTFSPSKSIPSKFNNPEMKGSLPALVIPSGPGILNELKPMNKAAGILSKGFLYPNSPANFRANGRAWGGTEKYKSRGRTSGINNIDMLNEQNRGPRTNSAKGAFASGLDPVDSPVSEFNGNNDSSTTVIKRDQYNVPDFPTKYDDALFFVIKSYSEDDIHKSIKYNVWSSTSNGNKRLDNAYQDSNEKMGQKGSKCPVFLFFSVNASGQFCGVAEMIGRVDFNKNMDFWQQDKWNGFFPVKWHIIKDAPNPHFRHIILENNDNKPVTNSRDTQEIRFPQGIEMLNIFKNYSSKTSILDDFSFYESRQKIMQDKRIRPSTRYLGHLQKLDEVMHVAPTGLQSIDLVAAEKKNELMMGDEATNE